jgi:hypothetical protein
VNTGVSCTAASGCPHPAPATTEICFYHERAARLAAMRHSPSAGQRALGYALTLLLRPEAALDREASG